MESKSIKESYVEYMKLAFLEAKRGFDEGGVPVGAIMVQNGNVIASGYNKRVHSLDPSVVIFCGDEGAVFS